jgi:aminoglycoside 6'-N-acetyltransferase
VDAETTPVLRGERVVLRPVAEADVPRLAAILREPEVAAWWGDYSPERARAELLEDPGWAIEVDGVAVGWLTATEEEEPDYRHVGFDIFLATGVHGRGLGREALALAVGHFVALGHHRFTIDPALANERAIRSYAAVGFRPVGVMRAYERGRDGAWHDNLLMDLLAQELEPPRGPLHGQ